jgi:hypothetical protein
MRSLIQASTFVIDIIASDRFTRCHRGSGFRTPQGDRLDKLAQLEFPVRLWALALMH